MSIVWAALRCAIFLLAALVSGTALAKAETAPEAVLTVANRDIATLRMTTLGASPELRVKRIHERLRQMDERDLSKPITRSHLAIDGNKGVAYSIGDRTIFILYEADLDPEEKIGLEEASQQVGQRFEKAIAALIEQGHGPVLAVNQIPIGIGAI